MVILFYIIFVETYAAVCISTFAAGAFLFAAQLAIINKGLPAIAAPYH